MKTALTPLTSVFLSLVHPTVESGDISADTQALKDALESVHEAIEKVQVRVTAIQRARRAAIAGNVPLYESGHFESIRHKCLALSREIEAAASNLDLAIMSAEQMDALAIEMKTAIETYGDRVASITTPLVRLTLDEHRALTARALQGDHARAELDKLKKTSENPVS